MVPGARPGTTIEIQFASPAHIDVGKRGLHADAAAVGIDIDVSERGIDADAASGFDARVRRIDFYVPRTAAIRISLVAR
jgi:hypothetical protein